MTENITAREDFDKALERVTNLAQTRPHISVYDSNPIKGIYMLYVDDFTDDRVIPAYIGKGTGKQGVHGRFLAHLLPLIALNRYSSDDYEHLIIETSKTDGNYRYPKILKYMRDHGKMFGSLRCVLIEECAEDKAFERESYWMNRIHSQFFGFNQLDSITVTPRLTSADVFTEIDMERQLLESDLANCERYWGYGYTRFNFRYVLDQWRFLLDEDDAYKRVRNIDVEGEDAREEARQEADELIEFALESNWPGINRKASRTELYKWMMYSAAGPGRIPNWYAELKHIWRRDLLPRDMNYDSYPIGDNFSPENWRASLELGAGKCHIRFELTARSAASGKSSMMRERPRIIRVDYCLVPKSSPEKRVSGGSFIDCDIARNLADERVHNHLKAELLKGSLSNYGWETWMRVPDLDSADEDAYLWDHAPGNNHGDWNQCGPTYTLKAEMGTGINGHSFAGHELAQLSEVLSHVLTIAEESNCVLIVYSNAVKATVLAAIREQSGKVPLALGKPLLDHR